MSFFQSYNFQVPLGAPLSVRNHLFLHVYSIFKQFKASSKSVIQIHRQQALTKQQMDLVWAPLLMLMYISHVRGGGLQVCLTIVNICSDIAIHLTHYITSSLLSLEPPHLWLRKVIVFRNQIGLYPALYTKGCSFHCNVFVMELILYMINDPLKQNKLSQV